MFTRAILPTGLLILTATLLMQFGDEVHPAQAAAQDSTRAASPAEIRWDGKLINDDERRRDALGAATRVAISRWYDFASRRGYRIDLDQDQRVVLLSDAERFKRFSTSSALVERTVRSLAPFLSPGSEPVVILRATSETDLATAQKGARALEFDGQFSAYLEEGDATARREVDARLVEAVASKIMSTEQPFLSRWMTDGIASFVAERSSSRALIQGELRTLRSVQREVSRRSSDEGWELDLFQLNGGMDADAVMQAEAMAIIAFLFRHHEAALGSIVADLGHHEPDESRPRYEAEQRAFDHHLGLAGRDEIARALQKGRDYRP